MTIKPIELKDANDFIIKHHRHNSKVTGHRFSLSLWHDGKLIGVCVCGRPVARLTDKLKVLEVNRLCTDGTPNACSKLYGAAARIAKEIGFETIQTFILESEAGKTLKAAGWQYVWTTEKGSFNSRSVKRKRSNRKTPEEPKKKYFKKLTPKSEASGE